MRGGGRELLLTRRQCVVVDADVVAVEYMAGIANVVGVDGGTGVVIDAGVFCHVGVAGGVGDVVVADGVTGVVAVVGVNAVGKMKKWQQDPDFVAWLAEMEYVEITPKGPRTRMSDGVYIYMWEAWRGALSAAAEFLNEQVR